MSFTRYNKYKYKCLKIKVLAFRDKNCHKLGLN